MTIFWKLVKHNAMGAGYLEMSLKAYPWDFGYEMMMLSTEEWLYMGWDAYPHTE